MAERESRPSVLIVDDTVENLHLLANMLAEQGYTVRPVRSGKQALQAAESAPPDLILLDVMMPEMDGYEVCRRLKDIDLLRDIPVLFLTSLTDVSEKMKGFAAGGADYISKPFQVDEVLARVEVHVGLRCSHRRLAASYEHLQAAERLRDDLVQMIVHDMRSPLAILTMMLDCLQGEVAPDGRVRDALDAATELTARVSRMANDVLDVSRMEESKLPLAREACDLVALCHEVAAALAPLARRHQLQVRDGLPVATRCDRALVGRVLQNLLTNAMNHTPAGGRITISVRRERDAAHVSVEDQGAGVPVDARARIFEKFGALALRRSNAYHSAGLGLPFCKLAIEAHGGRIGVAPAEPTGSIFWFTLPCEEAVAPPCEAMA